MTTEIAINQFNKGVNKDTDPKFIENSQLTNAINVEVTGEGKFMALKNIKGTSQLKRILEVSDFSNVSDYTEGVNDINVLGAYEVTLTINPTSPNDVVVPFYPSVTSTLQNRGIVIFSCYKRASDNEVVSQIHFYDVDRNYLWKHVETDFSGTDTNGKVGLDFQLDGAMDAVVYGEKSIDSVYFIDNYNTLRKLKCVIQPDSTDSYNTLDSARTLTARRYAPLSYVEYEDVDDKGYLVSGSYQFSICMYNTKTNAQTTWAPLTNPIPIYPPNFERITEDSALAANYSNISYVYDRTFLNKIYGGVPGEQTNKRVVLKVRKSEVSDEFYNMYDSYKLAVLKNIDGNNVAAQFVSITDPIFTSNATLLASQDDYIYYDGLAKETSTSVNEIVIEESNYETFKTLVIKDNILFGANVKYKNLDISSATTGESYTVTKKLGLDSSVFFPTEPSSGQENYLTGDDVLWSGGYGPNNDIYVTDNTTVIDTFSTIQIKNRQHLMYPVMHKNQVITLDGNTGCAGVAVPGLPNIMSQEINWTLDSDPANGPSIGAVTHIYIKRVKDLFLEDLDAFGAKNYKYKYNENIGEDGSSPIIEEPPLTIISVSEGVSLSDYYSDLSSKINALGLPILATNPSGTFLRLSYINSSYSGNFFQCGGESSPERDYIDGYIVGFAIESGSVGNEYTPIQPSDIMNYYSDQDWFTEDNSSEYEAGGYYYGNIENPKNNFGKLDFGYKNPLNAAKYRGYFRDEVYRYGLTYMNEFGNWSEAKPIDFSTFNVLRRIEGYMTNNAKRFTITAVTTNTGGVDGNDDTTITFNAVNYRLPAKCSAVVIDITGKSFTPQLLTCTYTDGTSRTITKDDLHDVLEISPVYTNLGVDYRLLIIKGIDAGFAINNYVCVEQPFGSYSDNSVDWKFPSRDRVNYNLISGFFTVGEFPSGNNFDVFGNPDLDQYVDNMTGQKNPVADYISSADDFDEDGFINALGLRIRAIKNHPSWAKALKIVRLKRKRNILSQSMMASCSYYMPYVDIEYDETLTNGQGFNYEYGTLSRKRFSFGPAFNIHRRKIDSTGSFVNGSEFPKLRAQEYDGESIEYDSSSYNSFLFGYFPEYIYQNSGVFYYPQAVPNNTRLQVVDAVTQFLDGPHEGKNSHREYEYPYKEFHVALRSDSKFNYYHSGTNVSRARLQDLEEPTFNLDASVLDYFRVFKNTEAYFLPYEVRTDKMIGKKMAAIAERHISARNYGPASSAMYGWVNTDGIFLRTDSLFIDPSFKSSDENAGTVVRRKTIIFDPREEMQYRHGGMTTYAPIMQIKGGTGNPGAPLNNREFNCEPVRNYYGPVSTQFICNLITGLDDYRYGELSDQYEWIDTGAIYYLKSSDVTDNVEINMDVYGGDCFITKQSIKLNQTVFTIENANLKDKLNNTNIPDDMSGRFLNLYENASEMGGVYVESEINTALCSDKFSYPISEGSKIKSLGAPKGYQYHFGYSLQNESKIWYNNPIDYTFIERYPSRIIYSDPKVYQSNVEGFDRFGILSTYDMDETYGGITKLVKLSNNDVIAIQEDGVANLNIGKNIVEQADGSQLVVNSSTLINNPRYISTVFGSRDINSITTNGYTIYMVDTKRRKLYAVGGEGGTISDIGMSSYFYSEYDIDVYNQDKTFKVGYDFRRGNLWVNNRPFTSTIYSTSDDRTTSTGTSTSKSQRTWLYNDLMKNFQTSIVPVQGYILDQFSAHNRFYIIGLNSLGLTLNEMYEGDYGEILSHNGSSVDSEFTIIVNPKVYDEKIFDNVIVNSDYRLKSADFQVERESGMISLDQTSLNFNPRQSTYEAQVLRIAAGNGAISGGRARGTYLKGTFKIDNTVNRQIAVSQIITKYRISSRQVNS